MQPRGMVEMINMEDETTQVNFTLVDDIELPPIIITMDESDEPKVVINRNHTIWLCLHRKVIAGCAERLFHKMDELLTGHLKEQRMYEKLE